MKHLILFLVLSSIILGGCMASSPSEKKPFKEIAPGSVYKGKIQILEPKADAEILYTGQDITIDASNCKEGYIMVKSESAKAKRKVRITLDQSYTYDLNTKGNWEVYPLQMNQGDYIVEIFENVEGTSYMRLFSQNLFVQEESIDKVFLYPSQYIWYTHADNAVRLSYDLCSGLDSDKEKVQAIFSYVSQYLTYDKEKAKTVESGYIPNLDEILEKRKGICFDYAGLFAAMCRAQNIPVRLIMGNLTSKNVYHAWNSVLIEGQWESVDVTYSKSDLSKEEDYLEDRRY